MKIIITEEQYNILNETNNDNVICKRCEHSWGVDKDDTHPYLCHMCGYDQKLNDYNLDELELFWKNYNTKEEVKEKWSNKYKRSIDCNNPKGFSQRAHCQGRKKHINESNEVSYKDLIVQIINNLILPQYEDIICNVMVEDSFERTDVENKRRFEAPSVKVTFIGNDGSRTPQIQRMHDDIMDEIWDTIFDYSNVAIDLYSDFVKECKGNINEDVKPNLNKKDINVVIKTLSILSPTFGEYIPLKFNLEEITTRMTTFLKRPIFVLHISVKNEYGDVYNIPKEIRYEISNELLKILGDMGLYDDINIEPYYDFIFNDIK